MQFVTCKFDGEGSRVYTYCWDGEPLEPGDKVMIPIPKTDDKWRHSKVVEIVPEPKYPCKMVKLPEPDGELAAQADPNAPSGVRPTGKEKLPPLTEAEFQHLTGGGGDTEEGGLFDEAPAAPLPTFKDIDF